MEYETVNLEVLRSLWHWSNQQKGGYLQDGMIDLDYQEESRLQLKNGDKKNYVCNAVDFLDHHLVCPRPIVDVKKKLEQMNKQKVV